MNILYPDFRDFIKCLNDQKIKTTSRIYSIRTETNVKMKTTLLSVLCVLCSLTTYSQATLNDLIATLLADTPIEEDLQELCDEIGGRVTGSGANKESVEWGYKKFSGSWSVRTQRSIRNAIVMVRKEY